MTRASSKTGRRRRARRRRRSSAGRRCARACDTRPPRPPGAIRGGGSCRGSAARRAGPGTAAACRAAAAARRARRARAGQRHLAAAARRSCRARTTSPLETVRRTLSDALRAVDVAALERAATPRAAARSRRRTRAAAGSAGASSAAIGVELGAGVDAHRSRRRLRVAAGQLGRVRGSCSSQRTAAASVCRSAPHDPVARALGSAACQRGDLAAHPLEVAQRHVAERARWRSASRSRSASIVRGRTAAAWRSRYSVDELGERELRHGAGSPRSSGSVALLGRARRGWWSAWRSGRRSGGCMTRRAAVDPRDRIAGPGFTARRSVRAAWPAMGRRSIVARLRSPSLTHEGLDRGAAADRSAHPVQAPSGVGRGARL